MTSYYLEVMSSQRQRDIEKAVARRRVIDSSASRPRESGTAAPAPIPSSTPGGSPVQPRLLLLLAALAGALLYAWSVRRGDTAGDRPGRSQWISTAIVGVLLLAGGNGGVSWGEQFVPTGVAALLVASVPLWMVLFAHFTGDDRLSLPVSAGLVLGLAGVALLVQPSGNAGHLLGSLVILGAAISWAAGSVYARRAPLPRRPLVSTGMEMLAGAVALLVLSAVSGELGRVHLDRVSLQSVIALAYLVVFGSLLAFSSYVWLLRHTRAAVAGTYAYVNPAVAVLLGWGFLGEAITTRVLVGGAVIILAVVLVLSAPALRRPIASVRLRVQGKETQGACPEVA